MEQSLKEAQDVRLKRGVAPPDVRAINRGGQPSLYFVTAPHITLGCKCKDQSLETTSDEAQCATVATGWFEPM
jgi:hypothetical protein